MRRREAPSRIGFEGQVVLDDFLYLWIWMSGEWVYLADFVEDDVQPGKTPMFNTQNHIVDLIALPVLD